MIIDTHTHLNSPELFKKRDLLIKKAISLGVKKMIVVGYDYDSSKKAIQIAHEYPGVVYAIVGIHPSETVKCEDFTLNEIEELIKDKYCVGVGEIGYDFHWDDVPELIQTDFFVRQIKLAHLYHKPIMIHMRDATEKTIEILRKNKEFITNGGVIHCYSGSAESVKDFVDLGFYISFGGPLTFTNNKKGKEALLKVPLDRLLFETDSPYLAPHPFRGQENEPCNTTFVVKEAAILLDRYPSDLEQIEENNVKRLFGI